MANVAVDKLLPDELSDRSICNTDELSDGSISNTDDSKKLKRTRHGNIIPRPNNCFLVYRRDISKQLRDSKQFPDSRSISKLVAQLWRTESDAVKLHYRELAKQQKLIHQLQYPDYKYKPRKRNEKGINDSEKKPTVPKRQRNYKRNQDGCRERRKAAEKYLSYTDYGVTGLYPDPIKQIVISELKDRINDLVSQGVVQIEEMHQEGSKGGFENAVIEMTTATTGGNVIRANPSELLLELKAEQKHSDCEMVNGNAILNEAEVAQIEVENLDHHSNDIDVPMAHIKVENLDDDINDIDVPNETEVSRMEVDNLDDYSNVNAIARVDEQTECSKESSKASSPCILPSSAISIKEVYNPDIPLDDCHFSFKSIEPVAESHLLLEHEALLIHDDSLDEASDESVAPLAAITNAQNALIERLPIVDSCIDYPENNGHDFLLTHSADIGADICHLENSRSITGNQFFADDTSSATPSLSVTSNSSLSDDDDIDDDLEDSQGSSAAYVPGRLSSCESPVDAKQLLERMAPEDIFGTTPISVAALRLHELLFYLPRQLVMQKLKSLHQNYIGKYADQLQQQEQEQEQPIMDWSLDDYIHME